MELEDLVYLRVLSLFSGPVFSVVSRTRPRRVSAVIVAMTAAAVVATGLAVIEAVRKVQPSMVAW